MSTILDINADAFFSILNFIPNIREKVRLQRVCKHFRWMVQQYFRYNDVELTDKEHIYYKGSRSEDSLTVDMKDLIKVCSKMRRLRNDIVPIHWNLETMVSLDYLQVLEIDWRKKQYRFDHFDQLLAKCSNLKELGLIGFEADHLSHKPRNLQSLCLDYCSIPFNEIKELVIINGKTLIRFEYHNLCESKENEQTEQDNHDELIETIGNHCPGLMYLRLYMSSSSIRGLRKLQNLRNLFLIMDVSGDDVRELMINNKHLQWMLVHQKDITYEEALSLCIQYCPEMKELSINNTRIPLFSQHEINLWRMLPNLRLIHGRPLPYYEHNLMTFASD